MRTTAFTIAMLGLNEPWEMCKWFEVLVYV